MYYNFVKNEFTKELTYFIIDKKSLKKEYDY